MKESEKALNVLVSTIDKMITLAIDKAKYDRTFFGIVVAVGTGIYTVEVMGQSYVIKSSQTFSLHERVTVTAMQGSFNNLVIRKI